MAMTMAYNFRGDYGLFWPMTQKDVSIPDIDFFIW